MGDRETFEGKIVPSATRMAVLSYVLAIVAPLLVVPVANLYDRVSSATTHLEQRILVSTAYVMLVGSVVAGVTALVQLKRYGGVPWDRKLAVAGIVVALIGMPIVLPQLQSIRTYDTANNKAACQNNMKELGLALSMYCAEYDNTLPSSSLATGFGNDWETRFTAFASKKGGYPPEDSDRGRVTWPMALYPYMKNKDIVYCPSDPDNGHYGLTVSYYWKAAVDYAWQKGFRKVSDFNSESGQIVFYEHNGWHWGDGEKGLVDNVTMNCTFMDGHVATKRLKDSGYTEAENPPGPLPKSGVGEPAWFNFSNGKTNKGRNWNPKVWSDDLP